MMNRKQIAFMAFMPLALLIVVMALLLAIGAAGATPEIVGYDEYIVSSGETLWSIAEESNGYGEMDRRDIIADIKAESCCDSDIYAGQTVYIPIYKLDK